MKTERCHPSKLVALLEARPIATIRELKAALGTQVDVTVFRKLRTLSYRTSYSHSGRYYTLDRLARFDRRGLWSYEAVGFSRWGTLVRTVETLVNQSAAGYRASELDNLLSVSVKAPLLKLVRDQRITRQKLAGVYLYCSAQRATSKRQVLARRVQEATPGWGHGPPPAEFLPDELRAAIVLFVSLLDEQQHRLYAGVESLKCGHGGDRLVAELLGLDVGTVARGRGELLAGQVQTHRVRRPGGGRKPVEKKRPRSSPRSAN